MILYTGPKSLLFLHPIVGKTARKFYSSQRFVPPPARVSLYLQNLRPQLIFIVKKLINHHTMKHVESSNKKLIESISPLIGLSSHWWQKNNSKGGVSTRKITLSHHYLILYKGEIMQLSLFLFTPGHVALWREIQIPLNTTPGLFLSLAIPYVSDHSYYQGSEGHHTGNDDEKIPVIVLRKP